MKTLASLVVATGGNLIGGDASFEQISTDTRSIRAGDLFIALRGERFDAHEFLERAQAAGAAALVVEAPSPRLTIPQLVVGSTLKALGDIARVYRQKFAGKVIAITGSSGKTTVKGMLGEICGVNSSVLVTEKNFNNQIGVPQTLFRLRDQRYAVVELGTSHAGEIAYLTSLARPDIALVNNVMAAHIGGFGSLQAIAKEKGEIYRNQDKNGISVINADDAFASYFERSAAAHVKWFSIDENTASEDVLVAKSVTRAESGCYQFELVYGLEAERIALQVPGKHMVSNALAAAACALAAGCALPDVGRGLAAYRGEKRRMEMKPGPANSVLIDDSYNANPGSVRAAIDYLSECSGHRILVLGDMAELGEKALDAHIELGEYAKHKGIDTLYTLGEAAALAAKHFGGGGMSYQTKQSLIEKLQDIATPQSVILVKGSRSAAMNEICDALSGGQRISEC